ncbi:uncharacterized protein LOC100907124 [Galendromus occidentalis]|uniref:Uncharacterized protein LOC100907124 n=1 Tax=Galendromus occidentalis TaxID=34638 RepID=A0AAJ6QPL1_9ACAR|nr:uncharacterized protein LOC100907124 [Galendromus occidentalis]
MIQAFKVQYRDLMLRWLVSKMDDCRSASELANTINVLEAIRWVIHAWDKVPEQTIACCFRKCGIIGTDGGERDPTEDVFSDDLLHLCARTGVADPCFMEDVERFRSASADEPCPQSADITVDEEEDAYVENPPREPPSASEALDAVETLKLFALTSSALFSGARGALLDYEKQIQDFVIQEMLRAKRQSTLNSFFCRAQR